MQETFLPEQNGPACASFIRLQSIKGGIGVVLALASLSLGSGALPAALLGISLLLVPLSLALLARWPVRPALLEQTSLFLSALCLLALAFVTGGLQSPFLIWLVLVPFEGALSSRRLVLHAAFAAEAALVALVVAGGANIVPLDWLTGPPVQWFGLSALVAIAQASLMALSAQAGRVAADAAAAAGEDRYRFLAENALDLITRHAPDGRVRFAGPAALALLGYGAHELENRRFFDFVHAEDREALDCAFAQANAGHAASAEIRLKDRSGHYIWADFRCRLAGHVGEGDSDIIAVTRDVTDRKIHEHALISARDTAEEASRAKSRFLANMSHELRTPLNAIIGFSDVMKSEMFGHLGGPRYLEYAQLINDSGVHLLGLINAVLDMSKIEAGRYTLAPELLELEPLIAQAVGFVRLQAERAEVALHYHVSEEALLVCADKRALLRMAVNLLANGVKFTPPGGSVSVTAHLVESGLEIAVTDSGVGIAAEDLERLGTPFEQIDSEFTRTKEGTGLGLALVRGFAGLHGGTVTIESELGVGTTVRIMLPEAGKRPKRSEAAA